jgi:hypothetical protein
VSQRKKNSTSWVTIRADPVEQKKNPAEAGCVEMLRRVSRELKDNLAIPVLCTTLSSRGVTTESLSDPERYTDLVTMRLRAKDNSSASEHEVARSGFSPYRDADRLPEIICPACP